MLTFEPVRVRVEMIVRVEINTGVKMKVKVRTPRSMLGKLSSWHVDFQACESENRIDENYTRFELSLHYCRLTFMPEKVTMIDIQNKD